MGSHVTALNLLALEANLSGCRITVVRSACYPCSLAMGCALWPFSGLVFRASTHLASKANLNDLGMLFAERGLLCLVCLLWVLHSVFRAFNLFSINGELCGSGIMVVAGDLLFHFRLLWVLHLESLMHVCLSLNLSGIESEFQWL